jgi:hypothetical protein
MRIGTRVHIADVNSVSADMAGRPGAIADVDWHGRYWLDIGADELAGPYRRDEIERDDT